MVNGYFTISLYVEPRKFPSELLHEPIAPFERHVRILHRSKR